MLIRNSVVEKFPPEKLISREARDGDKQKLAKLIHFESQFHRHLDYRSPLEWLNTRPFYVLEYQNQLLGALSCPEDVKNIAWIRLFVVSTQIQTQVAWTCLWNSIIDNHYSGSAVRIGAIPLQGWFIDLLKENSFFYQKDVIVLRSENSQPITGDQNQLIRIRAMNFADLKTIQTIDYDAFDVEWQTSFELLEVAYRQSIIATVAENGRNIIGYQISTSSSAGGHVSRLAVEHQSRMKGVGWSLLQDLISRFNQRGVTKITVNTQSDNAPSLSLYEKAGFVLTGDSYPVYFFDPQG